jgi:hypothetical protein
MQPAEHTQPSPCIVLVNMFDPTGCALSGHISVSVCRADGGCSKDDAFFEDVRLDVEDEAQRFGQLQHMFVDPQSPVRAHSVSLSLSVAHWPQGHVFLKFATAEEATRAYVAMNRRYFAGSMITVEYIPVPTYNARFALA